MFSSGWLSFIALGFRDFWFRELVGIVWALRQWAYVVRVLGAVWEHKPTFFTLRVLA